MKKVIIITTLCMSIAFQAMAWGPMGHDVTAYIAEKNLTKRAEKRVKELLDGHSLVYYANWMDNIRDTEEYKHTSTWHFRNVDEGETVESMPLHENGDVVTATDQLVAAIKSGKLNEKEEKDAVKMIIHMVGDMHCPMHAGRLSDLGGNRHKVYFFGKETNLHSIWDSALIEAAHKWSYQEWWEQLDIINKRAKAEIQVGKPIDWFTETVEQASKIYERTPIDCQISYEYVNESTPVIEEQLFNAGIRLAFILNELYN